MALRILHNETIFRHLGVVQRLLSTEKTLSSSVQLAALTDAVNPKDANNSGAKEKHPNIITSFRTSESDPRNHKEEHLARFYTIPEETENTIFKYGGLPKKFSQLCHVFTETSIMVRQPFLEIKSYVERIDFSKPTVRIVLYGHSGFGKSLTVAHVVHYGYMAGYMLVHVPWVNMFMRRCKDASPSESKPGMMDVPINASAWLVHFRSQNQHLLTKYNLTTTSAYQYGPRDTIPKGATLEELIEFGVGRAKYACDVVEVLLKEIKAYSNSGLFKTMVVIDGFNGLFSPFLITERRQKLNARCTLALPFLDMTRFDWCNGVAILTVDTIAHSEPYSAESHLPLYLLGRDGWEHVDPFIPIEVVKYDSAEVNSALDYLTDRRWIQHPSGRTEEGRAELSVLCGGSGYELVRICASL